jgi:hypothetical protein
VLFDDQRFERTLVTMDEPTRTPSFVPGKTTRLTSVLRCAVYAAACGAASVAKDPADDDEGTARTTNPEYRELIGIVEQVA